MEIRKLILSTVAMMALGAGCVVDVGPVNVRNAYEGCNAGQACGSGTLCTSASFTTGGPGNLCTTTCSIGAACPDFGVNSAFAPTCVVDGATGLGQCYDTCASNLDCGVGTQCALIPATPSQICVPIGAGGTPAPPQAAPYTGCSPPGGACSNNTVCSVSMFTRAGAATGNLCTIACTSGNAAMCPGYQPGAAIQSVECVAPAGNPGAAQCMRLCNPANNNADCAPFLTTCAAVPMAAGVINVCVP